MLAKTRKYPLRGYILGFGSTRYPRGHEIALSALLSPSRHMQQLLLVTSCDWPAGIGASLRTDGRTDGRTNERTDGHTDVTLEIVFQTL